MNTLMLERADLEKLIEDNNSSMMADNLSNHVRFITSILKNYNPEVFVETILWAFEAYRSHGFTTNYWSSQFNGWITLLKEVLPSEYFLKITPYYERMQLNIPIFVLLSDEKLKEKNTNQ